jgi:competence protein ComEC
MFFLILFLPKTTWFMSSDRMARFSRTRPLTVAALLLGSGIYVGAGVEPSVWQAAALLACCLLILFKKTRRMVFAAVFMAGFISASLTAHPVVPDAGTYTVSATLRENALINTANGQVRSELEHISLDGQSVRGNGYWTFYLEDGEAPPNLSAGDHVVFEGRLYHPQAQVNPHGFDFRMYLYQNGMIMGFYGRTGLIYEQQTGFGLRHWSNGLREWLMGRLSTAMGEDSALAAAMVLGIRSLLPEEDVEAFRRTGTAHVLAISGLHIGCLIGLAGRLFSLLCVKRKRHWIILLVFLSAYAFLTGLSASVIRASVLGIAFSLARSLRKPYDSISALSAAFILILVFKPLELFAPGFVLTFSAVLGIVLLQAPLQRRMTRLPGWLSGALAVSFSAAAGTLIPMMAYYRQVHSLSPIINLIMVPWAGLMTILFFLTLFFPFLGMLSSWMTRVFLATVHLFGRLPFLTLEAFSPPWEVWLGVWLLIMLCSGVSLINGWKRMVLASCALLFIIIGVASVFITPPRYTLFANGQGDGAILEVGSHTMVVDVGENGQDMASYLKARGRKVNALVISHLHSDHASGLEAFLRQGVAVETVYLPAGYERYSWDQDCLDRLQALNVQICTLAKGSTLPYAKVLWPDIDALPLSQNGNNISLGLLMHIGNVRILSLGDLTGWYEHYAAVQCDILKVSHHGSRDATGDDFLAMVAPSAAFITCRSEAALPSAVVLERLQNRNIAVFRTDEAGALIVQPDDGGFRVKAFILDGK